MSPKIRSSLAIIGIAALVALTGIAVLRQTYPQMEVQGKYMLAAQHTISRVCPYCDQSLSTLSRRYHQDMDDLRETLHTLGQDPSRAEEVASSLLDVWPGGFVSYNKWYVLGMARRMAVLDDQYRPIVDARPVDEEARRMSELHSLGGNAAIQAYRQAIGR
jgi:hypothetical protein